MKLEIVKRVLSMWSKHGEVGKIHFFSAYTGINVSTLSYDDYKLSVMRIFQRLKDPEWFTRNSAWLVGNGVDRWNNFQRCYNKECIPECPKSLALIYAATKVF